MSFNSPNAAVSVELDPQNNGSLIRKAFLIEGLLNLLSFPLVTHTRPILHLLLKDAAQITPGAVFFARFFGGVVTGGLSMVLFGAIPNTRAGIESRRNAYLTLGWGEVLLIPVLVNEYLKGELLLLRDGRRADDTRKDGGKDAAVSPKVALGSIMLLLPPLLWRYVCSLLRRA